MAVRPMFPLGTVLLPGALLPLHLFEPRYRAFAHDCLGGEREFGVVLIDRGSEVGGDDRRTSVGTLAGIIEAEELPDGRWALLAVGLRRIRVSTWLTDDPYPRAEIEEWPDPPPSDGDAVVLDLVAGRLRRVLGLAAEIGDPAPPSTTPLADDPIVAGYQIGQLAPLGALDRHRVLCAPSAGARLALLGELLDVAAEVLELRLAGG